MKRLKFVLSALLSHQSVIFTNDFISGNNSLEIEIGIPLPDPPLPQGE